MFINLASPFPFYPPSLPQSRRISRLTAVRNGNEQFASKRKQEKTKKLRKKTRNGINFQVPQAFFAAAFLASLRSVIPTILFSVCFANGK